MEKPLQPVNGELKIRIASSTAPLAKSNLDIAPLVAGIAHDFSNILDVTGCGSTFHIYLPLPRNETAADDIDPPLAQYKIEDRSQQGETILYAEDDVRLAGLTQRLLEREGFRVLTAQNGFEAVDLHRWHRGEVVLGVLDARLPKLDGLEAFRRMRKIIRN